MDTPHKYGREPGEGSGETPGFGGGGQGEETTEAAAQDERLRGGEQDDGTSGDDFFLPPDGTTAYRPFVADKDQYNGRAPFRCPRRVPPCLCNQTAPLRIIITSVPHSPRHAFRWIPYQLLNYPFPLRRRSPIQLLSALQLP